MAKDFLLTPLTYLPGVGPRRAKALAEELDLYTYLDLLHYFPTKYVDRSRIYQIRELRGEMPHVELKGYIRDFKEVGEGRKKRLVAYFTDGTGTIELVWFRSMPYIPSALHPGAVVPRLRQARLLQRRLQHQPPRDRRGVEGRTGQRWPYARLSPH